MVLRICLLLGNRENGSDLSSSERRAEYRVDRAAALVFNELEVGSVVHPRFGERLRSRHQRRDTTLRLWVFPRHGALSLMATLTVRLDPTSGRDEEQRRSDGLVALNRADTVDHVALCLLVLTNSARAATKHEPTDEIFQLAWFMRSRAVVR
jgi:hypothetical protein